MPTLYANPYDTSRPGFYFDDLDEYEAKAQSLWPHHEAEHSIDFIDGSKAEVALWEEGGNSSPAEIEAFYDWVDEPEYAQVEAYAAMGFGYADGLSDAWGKAKSQRGLGVQVREGGLEDLAAEYVEEGLVDASNYFDYERFGRDVAISGDMTNDLDPDDPDEAQIIDFYENMSDRELGEYVIDEIFGGDVTQVNNLQFYVDEKKLAYELGFDYWEFTFAGKTHTARED